MPYTKEEQVQNEIKLYGSIWSKIFDENLKETIKFMGFSMTLMSMMSDAQHVMQVDTVKATQILNQVKKLIILNDNGAI